MKNLNLILGLIIGINSSAIVAGGISHAEHRAGSKSNNSSSASVCKEARISGFKPMALSEVTPGSEFSFIVVDANNPKQIEVAAKKIAVPITVEEKGEMLIVRGKLPETLVDTAARITVKVKGKNQKCNSEEGWLLKITH